MDWIYIILGLIVAAILAIIPANIAKSKGRDFATWYIYGFLLWIIAIIHAASLPYPPQIQTAYIPTPGKSEDIPKLINLSQETIRYYDINAPLDFISAVIQKNESTFEVFIDIHLISYFESPIKAMKLDIQCFNAFSEPVRDINVFHTVLQDLIIEPRKEIKLPLIKLIDFGETRFVHITLIQALLETGIWQNANPLVLPVGRQWVGQDLSNSQLLYGEKAIYQPELTDYGWNCICGRPNGHEQEKCIRCNTARELALYRTSESMQADSDKQRVLIMSEEKKHQQIANENAKREKDRIDTEAARRLKIKKRNIIIGMVAAIVFIVIIAGYLLAINIIIPGQKYNAAKELIASGKYDEAIILFGLLGDFKDSKTQINESKYQKAKAYISQKKYSEAISLFKIIADYKDSQTLIQETIFQLNEPKYQNAIRLLQNKDYPEAITAFEQLADYKDSKSQFSEARYLYALDLLSSKKYCEAKIYLRQILDFRDSLSKYRSLLSIIPVLSAGSNSIVGVTTNGTVVAVGPNEHNQCNVSSWKNIVAISSGAWHTVGLEADGTVVAVGSNENNQCDVSSWKNIVAISAGPHHTVGLKEDGTVVAVGDNRNNQCDVSAWKNIIAISAGQGKTVGLKEDGTVIAVGDNEYNQCDVSEWKNIIAISAGGWHTVGLKADGTVVAIGNNDFNQCDVFMWKNIVAISAAYVHTVGLKADGTVVAVGSDENYQCQVSAWKNVVAISACMYFTVGLEEDGTVAKVGYSEYYAYDVSSLINIE